MEQITQNLQDPSWWFTGLFFVIAGIAITKLFSNWLPGLWRKISRWVPAISLRIKNWNELKTLRMVRRFRQHQIKVNWLIGRFWSIATVTVIYAIFACVAFLLSPNVSGHEENRLFPVILFIPMYMLEFLTLWEKRNVMRVIKAHIAWNNRITRCSSNDALARAA